MSDFEDFIFTPQKSLEFWGGGHQGFTLDPLGASSRPQTPCLQLVPIYLH